MNTTDRNGRAWAILSDLKEGQTVELDGGFTCVAKGTVILHADNNGLYFKCSEGEHHIAGHADDGEHCVGIYQVGPAQAPQ